MAANETRIRYYIAGRWSADDFSQLLRSANDIYNLSIVLSAARLRDRDVRSEMFPLDRRKVRRIAAVVAPRPWLDVTKITYASPGSIDLVGLGAVVGHLKDFTLGLLDRFQDRAFRKLELQEKLRLSENAKFEDEVSRSNQIALVRHSEVMRTLEVKATELRIEKHQLQNRALHLANLDNEGKFVRDMIVMMCENDLAKSEIEKIGTWLDSRASPVRELAELKQIVDVELLESDRS